MKRWLFRIIRYTGIPALVRTFVQRNRVTILMFHALAPDEAEKIFRRLRRMYNLVGLGDVIVGLESGDRRRLPKKALVITFDDGLTSNYGLLPVLNKIRVPMTIFLSAGIVGTNRAFWFLCEGPWKSGGSSKAPSNTEKLRSLVRGGFRFDRDLEVRQALSRKEIDEMRPFVDFQSHGMFHRNVLTCGDDELTEEIFGSKKKLEADFSLAVRAFAYPNGDYSERVAELVRDAGYKCGLTNDPGYNRVGRSDPFRMKRLPGAGPTASVSVDEAVVRASGVWDFFKILAGK